ncbi:MAG: ComF family protein [Desulfobacterales bacterium]|nr:ComF family protein [Desulfobacterales bacterium]
MLFRVLSAIKDTVFPSRCFVCRSFFHHLALSERNVSQGKCHGDHFKFADLMPSFLCPACLNDFSSIQHPICIRCGKLFKTREGDDHECEDCITFPKYFTIARAAGIYDRSLMTLIHQLKYKGKIQLAKPLGKLLFTSLFNFWGSTGIDVIVPVPLHKKRFKKRGFNQAYLLIKNWEEMNEKVDPRIVFANIDKDLLIRQKHTKPQTGLSRKERIKNIRNAFMVTHPEKVKEKRVLIVDDVYTTGATTNECARILLEHGAKRVDVLTLARAV